MAVSGCRGIARQLEVTLVQKRLGREALWELIALFRRYDIPLTALASLAEKARFAWLADEKWDWHENMLTTGADSPIPGTPL
ncbi:hypothetical protein HF313_04305 [Massilia atriviolacea]|uniref:Uncharacterized protein n=1 Tax=Massilia atriviolacea TaxID=2495579 RepID=A0A430HD80_9BURK|nr:hypothetical protein [Massilia atriviolacea]RSZ55473.1 hypothetical protein EJB06_29120 [Massilia atriviolacea]